jgi:hypothetical protein
MAAMATEAIQAE